MGLVSVVLAACGTTPTVDSRADGVELPELLGPAVTLEKLLDALAADLPVETAPYVDEDQLALLTFIDGTSPAQIAAMIEGEVPSEVRSSFWRTFAESVADLSGASIERLEVGEPLPIGQDGRFVSVQTTIGASGTSSPWVMRAVGGGWRLDLLATFGGAFAPNMWDWIGLLPQDAARLTVLETIIRNQASFGVARQIGQGRLPAPAITALEQLENLGNRAAGF